MDQPSSKFRDDVYALVAQIPRGRIMTYGQLAALCGHPRAARQVGGIAHFGPANLPWWRVVNKSGGLAAAYTNGGREEHRRLLEEDGIYVSADYQIDVEALLWWPEGKLV